MPEEPSGPPPPAARGAGRNARTGPAAANTSVPASRSSALVSAAAAVDCEPIAPAISTGPAMYVISSPALSSANALCASERSPSMSGHIARRHGPIGGVAAPATTAHAAIAANGAPAGSAANAVSAAAASAAAGTSTAGCPRRSAVRPSAGAHAAEASAYSPAATPAAANDPVSSFARSTNTSPSAVSGVRAAIEAMNTRAEPGARSTVSMRSSVAARAHRVEGFGRVRIRAVRCGDARHGGGRRYARGGRRSWYGGGRRHPRGRGVISFVFGPEDLGRVRFAVSPLFELVSSLDALRDPAAHSLHEPWAREARKAVKDLDFWLLDAAAPEVGYCYRPDFVAPPPTKPVAELREELERVRATSAEQVTRELGWAYPRGLPPGAKRLLEHGLDSLVDAMAAYWELAIEPHWPEVKAILEADVASRAAQLAAAGPLAALSDLHADVGYRDGVLEIRRPYEETVDLQGRGVLLIPSAFRWPRVWAMFDPPWQPSPVYTG